MIRLAPVFFNPWIILKRVLCRYKKGHRKLSWRIKVPASRLSNKNRPAQSARKKKPIPQTIPRDRLAPRQRRIVCLMAFSPLPVAASDTKGIKRTEAELVRAEGKRIRLKAIPIKTP